MMESRMTRNCHVRFGERYEETRQSPDWKVRFVPTLSSGEVVSDLVAKIEGKPKSGKKQIAFGNKKENHKQVEEGVNYIQGMGCEFYVRLSQETWKKLNEYAEYVGTASLNGAVARLLNEVYSEVG